MDRAPQTRHTLLARLRAPGDNAAWAEFVSLYEPLIYGLARRRGLQDADARDLCQEVFRAVAGAIDRWDPARGSFRGWLSRIARNLSINLLVRQRRHPRGSGDTGMLELLAEQPAPDPGATAEFEAEYRKRVFEWAADEVRGGFSPTTWQAFWRTAVEARPVAAVAEELGLTAGAVYIARSRVLTKLRARVERLGEGTELHFGEDGDGGPRELL